MTLREAVHAIYYAGVWHCDRPVDERKLWTDLRDAAGFEPGQSPAHDWQCSIRTGLIFAAVEIALAGIGILVYLAVAK
jgi:hypothetical protein